MFQVFGFIPPLMSAFGDHGDVQISRVHKLYKSWEDDSRVGFVVMKVSLFLFQRFSIQIYTMKKYHPYFCISFVGQGKSFLLRRRYRCYA